MADEKGKKESAPPSTNSLHPDDEFGLKGHWKCLAACTLLSFCPFQYGLDFGLIGGMQSMLGFLRVRADLRYSIVDLVAKQTLATGFRL